MPGSHAATCIDFVITLAAAAAVFAYWVANRKRIAAETVGRAEEQASASCARPSARPRPGRRRPLLEAKEKSHDCWWRPSARPASGASRLQRRAGARARDAALTERLSAADRREQELQARADTLASRGSACGGGGRALRATGRLAAARARTGRGPHRRGGPGAAAQADRGRRAPRRGQPGQAARGRSARDSGVRARQASTEAIQRSAAEHAIETTVSVVDLPSDDMKGRIIGREGRNIRALEMATGVDLIVDDTPGRHHPLGLRPVPPRDRQAGHRAAHRRRPHPPRAHRGDRREGEGRDGGAIREEGEAAAFELGIHDLHPEILRLMGRLKFRTSYGQNVLNHSKEVAHLAGIMARELGLDAHVAMRAAFSTTSARPSTASCRARTSSSASTSCAARRERGRGRRPWPPTTWTSTGRRSRR